MAEPDEARGKPAVRAGSPWVGLVASIATVALATAIGWVALGQRQLADVVMVYLLGVVLVSMRFGYGPSLVAAVLSVLCFNFFFIPPYYTFVVTDVRHVVTFAVMFLVAAVISGLTQRVRHQAEAARERERRTASLYATSRALAAAMSLEEIVQIGGERVREFFGGGAAVVLDSERDRDRDRDRGELTVPLAASRGRVGVLRVTSPDGHALDDADRRHLEALAQQIAAAIERGQLAEQARRAELEIESERLRSSLLSSVSHDLRTPLAAVTGAASTLLDPALAPRVRRELTETVLSEADRLNRLVQNLLDMTRLEAGALRVRKQWMPLEEVIGTTLNRLEALLGNRDVVTSLPEALSLVPLDAILIEQVLVNLLENAAKHTPAGSPIEIRARVLEAEVEVEIADRGPGIAEAERERVFDKFYRSRTEATGAGLGLTICRGIVVAHGGRIWVEARAGGGSSFRFALPLEGEPPVLEESDASDGEVALSAGDKP